MDNDYLAPPETPPEAKTHHWRVHLSNNIVRYGTVSVFVVLFAFIGVRALSGGSADSTIVGSVTDYTDPSYLTNLPFGTRSFYDLPENAYMNTVPATSLLNSVGVNYDANPDPTDANQVPQVDHLLKDSGFKEVRIIMPWGGMNRDNPTQLGASQISKLQQDITAMKANGLRPLITLEAYDSDPVPYAPIKVSYTTTPKVGDTKVQVTAASAAQIVPGRTGISNNGNIAGILVSSVSGDTLTLSKPITTKTDISSDKMQVLAYAPFQRPFLANGTTPNPAFATTMNGWLAYVNAISAETKSILGSDQFDIEIWNELLSNRAFLNADSYYSAGPDLTDRGDTKQQILTETANFMDNPANGFSDVRITDGFASQTPFVSGASLPTGVIALSKHYYPIAQAVYPQDLKQNSIKPLNALLQGGSKTKNAPFVDNFVPSYVAHFPESWLSGLTTETEVRDMSPITNDIYNAPHGVNSGNRTSQVWETEWSYGLVNDPEGLHTVGASTKKGHGAWPPNDAQYIQAKADIRYLSSYVNKGLSQVDFLAANGQGDHVMIDPTFLSEANQNPSAYPGDAAGGEITQVLQRFLNAFSGAQTITQPRSLSLEKIDDYTGGVQFQGNGTAQYPDLYDRDLLGFFPYQVTNNSFMIPVYIQTEDAEKIYNASDPNVTKFDMPAETYNLTIGGIYGNKVKSVSMYDPLTQANPPVTVVSKGANYIEVQVPVTDSPRLLSITDCSANCNETPPAVLPPTINITSPVAGANVTGSTSITATATVDPTRTIASVQYDIDGNRLSTLLTTAPYAFQWKAQNITSGTHILTAIIQDSSGATATSPPVSVTVNNGVRNPSVSITTPHDTSSVSGIVNIQSIANSDPSTNVASVQYVLDDVTDIGPPITTPPYTYAWNTNLAAKGTHRLRAIVTDGLGNTSKSNYVKVKILN
jgi:hypothetical protein